MQRGELFAGEEAKEVESVGRRDNDPRRHVLDQVERVMGVVLHCVADLEPSAMDVDLNRPALLRGRACWNPDVEVQTVFVLDVVDGRSGGGIVHVYSIVRVVRLWTDGAELCIVAWLAGARAAVKGEVRWQ